MVIRCVIEEYMVFVYISELQTILSYTHSQEPDCPDKRGTTVFESSPILEVFERSLSL